MPLSQYGVVRVYGSITFNGRAQVTIAGSVPGPFFVSALTLFLNVPATANIVLNTINIDSVGSIQLSASGTAAASQVVVVASGSLYGDVVQSIPSYLSFLIMKDPLANNAIVADGGSGGGIVITITYMTGTAYGSSVALTAIATVVAPSDMTIAMTIA